MGHCADRSGGERGRETSVTSRPVPVSQSSWPDRLTAATSPLAAFAGLSVGLLVVKMTAGTRSASHHIRTPRCSCPGLGTRASGAARTVIAQRG